MVVHASLVLQEKQHTKKTKTDGRSPKREERLRTVGGCPSFPRPLKKLGMPQGILVFGSLQALSLLSGEEWFLVSLTC